MSFNETSIEIRRDSNIEDDGEDLTFDLLFVTPKIEDFWVIKEKLSWQTRELWIVPREGLMLMNRLAGHAKDLIDIDKIENEEN